MIVEQQAIPEVFVARNNDPWLIAVVYPVVQDSTLNVVSMNPRTSFRRLLSQLVVAWILQVLDQFPAPYIVLVMSLISSWTLDLALTATLLTVSSFLGQLLNSACEASPCELVL